MLGKEGVSTLAGYGASNLVYDKTNNQTLGMIAGILASTGSAKGLNMADAKLGWSNKGVKGNVVESVTGNIETRVVVRLIQNHILTVDLHLEKVLLKKYGRMLKVLMDWLEIQIQVRLLIGHQENLEKGYGVWDMGHIPEAKYLEMHEAYMNGELTTKEFVDWYNDPANYRPELPSNNRSHKYE